MNLDPYPLEPDSAPPAATPPAPSIAPPGHPCRRCGYDLRGLPLQGNCPECGASVARSLRGNMLELADPLYLRRLALGALLVELGVVLICLVPIGGVVLAMVLTTVQVTTGLMNLMPMAGAAAAIAAAVLGLAGWFVLTVRDPAHIGADESDPARLTTRIATVACSACWLFSAAVSTAPSLAATAPGGFALLMSVAGSVLAVAVFVQAVASMAYLRHLARRVPDAALVAAIERARMLAVVAGAACLAAALFGWIGSHVCAPMILGIGGFLLTLVFLVRYAEVVDRARRHLSDLAAAARAQAPVSA